MQDIVTVATTVSDKQSSSKLCAVILSHRLAACIQCEEITSVYRWDGQIQNEEEIKITCKTIREAADSLVELILSQHPYDVPELTVQKLHVTDAYGDWVRSEVSHAIP